MRNRDRASRSRPCRKSAQDQQGVLMASLMLPPYFRGGIRQMKSKESSIAALVVIAAVIAMAIAAAAGDRDGCEYQDTEWQELGAVRPVGHRYESRNRAHYDPTLPCDEDGDGYN